MREGGVMTLSRRGFLSKAARVGTAAAATAGTAAAAPPQPNALQRPPKPIPAEAVGLLYDSTLCIGCKACVKACKDANGMPPDINAQQTAWNEGTWDTPMELSGKTLNVIKVYTDGTM